MAKFLIFALVAIPVCSSLWTGFPKLEKEEVLYKLKDNFGLTPDDLMKECNVDFNRAWRKIGAALDKSNAIYRDVTGKVLNFADPDGNEENKRYYAVCRKSEPYKNAIMDVIKTALPCADKDSLDKHFETAKPQMC